MSAPKLLEQQKGFFLSGLPTGVVAGSCGIVGGSAAAIAHQNPRVFIYAFGTGINCFLLGTAYSVIRQNLVSSLMVKPEIASSREKIQISAIAGGLTGATGGLILRGRANVIPGAIMFTLFGMTGQFIYNKLDNRQTRIAFEAANTTPEQRKEMKEQSVMERILRSDSSPVKRLTDDEYKALLRKQLLVIDADIALVDEEITSLSEKKS